MAGANTSLFAGDTENVENVYPSNSTPRASRQRFPGRQRVRVLQRFTNKRLRGCHRKPILEMMNRRGTHDLADLLDP